MPISVQWDNPDKTLLRWNFEGKWTWDDYYAAMEQNNALLDSIQSKADLLIDMQQTNIVAAGFTSQFRRISQFHPKAGFAIIVLNSRFIEIMLNMLMNFQPAMRLRLSSRTRLKKAFKFGTNARPINRRSHRVVMSNRGLNFSPLHVYGEGLGVR